MLEVLVIVFAYTFHRAGERALQRRAGPHPCIFTDVAHEEAAQVIADTRLEAGAGNDSHPVPVHGRISMGRALVLLELALSSWMVHIRIILLVLLTDLLLLVLLTEDAEPLCFSARTRGT